MDEEAKAGPKPDSNANAAAAVEAAAAAPLPPSSSEAAEREAKAEGAAEEEGEVVERLVELVGEIAAISDFRNSYRRQFCNLSRRIRLLVPMLEEAKEAPAPLPAASEAALRRLRDALHGAGELLRLGSSGSKIFLVGFLALWLWSFVALLVLRCLSSFCSPNFVLNYDFAVELREFCLTNWMEFKCIDTAELSASNCTSRSNPFSLMLSTNLLPVILLGHYDM